MENSNNSRRSFFHYLPYSEEDEKMGMVCTCAGNIDTPPNTIYPPNKSAHPVAFRAVDEGRTLPEFQLIYISAGEGIFSAEGTTYFVKPGSMLLLLPGMKHFYKPRYDIGWHEYWVGFTGTFFKNMVKEGMLSKERIFFKIGLHDHVFAIFNRIFEELRLQRPLFQMRVCSQVFLLLAEILSDERRKEHPTHLQKIVEKTKCLIETNIDKEIDITSIAREIGISASRLNEVFKTYTSMTPYHYYIQLKINMACRLLEQEDVSIKEVSFRLGFNDQNYFSRLFKQKTGVPPSEWNKHI
jgi:AraC-like DNA-binding protein